MVFSYGITQQGAYHVKNNTPCQDAHSFCRISDRFAIGAVADGLGSERYSDIAAKIAVSEAVNYCRDNLSDTSASDTITTVLNQAFSNALACIENTAKENNHPLDQYDTTLAVVVFLDGNVYYGNSGDSGIVVLNADGTYESITEQQRDDCGCVFPLCFGEEYWAFGTKNDVASVFLATDGMYETLFPYLLKNEEVNIYVALARFMMDNDLLKFSVENEADIQKRMETFISSIPGEQVSDDKTVLVMLDDSVCTQKQSDEYYAMPDWVKLKQKRDEEYMREAYPHLFQEE